MDKELVNNIDIILMKDKLKKLKETLTEHNKDSEGYLKQFIERCGDGQVEDLEWVKDKDTFEDFFLAQPEEYGAIYDFAIVQITKKLLTLLEE